MTEKEIQRLKDTLPKGIDGWKNATKEQKQLDRELACREMINSCLIYGSFNYDFYNEETKEFKEYSLSYVKDLGKRKVLKLIKEQKESFKKATVHHDVYTDFEGCTYNSCDWGD